MQQKKKILSDMSLSYPGFSVWNTSPEKLKLVIDLGKFKHGTEKHFQCQQKSKETIYSSFYLLYTLYL